MAGVPAAPVMRQLNALSYASQRMVGTAVGYTVVGMTEALGAARGAQAELARSMHAIFGAHTFRGSNALKTGHQDVGEAARRSLISAYSHRTTRKNTPSYQSTGVGPAGPYKRYSGRALQRALSNPDNIHATPDGLSFLDLDILDSQARQWRRLNFGAGGAAGASPRQYPVGFEGMLLGSLGLDPDPRPAFFIPRGYWFTGGGQRVDPGEGGTIFYASGARERPRGTPGKARTGRGRSSPARLTKGIETANFLDAAVRAIANNILPMYVRVYGEYVEEHADRAARQAQSAGVALVRPGAGGPVVFVRSTRENRPGRRTITYATD